jgi:uncharacterized protein (TIRG00374 family)
MTRVAGGYKTQTRAETVALEAQINTSSVPPAQFMANKRPVATIVVLVFLLLLVWREANAWRHFVWSVFWSNARDVSWTRALAALAMTYAGYALRAARWRVFLRPIKDVPTTRLLGPTLIGYTGLALLGRPGEVVRPFMIARKERLSLSSQIAVLAVERIFDSASAVAIVTSALVLSAKLNHLPYLQQFRRGGLILAGIASFFAVLVLLLCHRGEVFGHLLQRTLAPVSSGLAHWTGDMVRAFSRELKMIRGAKSFVEIVILSIAIWLLSGFSYLETIRAFSGLRSTTLSEALLLLGFGLVGSLAQIPGGGSQQLIVIAALIHVFGVPAELAVSCSILGWLTIFMAPVPVGLLLLRGEHLSLRSLSPTIVSRHQ